MAPEQNLFSRTASVMSTRPSRLMSPQTRPPVIGAAVVGVVIVVVVVSVVVVVVGSVVVTSPSETKGKSFSFA